MLREPIAPTMPHIDKSPCGHEANKPSVGGDGIGGIEKCSIYLNTKLKYSSIREFNTNI